MAVSGPPMYIPQAPLRTSALRTLGAYANVFALESFMDELAAAAGADPVEFRLRHLKDPWARAVIEAAAQRAGWRPHAKGDGARGRGFGFAKYKNLACYCAVVADLTVDRTSGQVRVAHAVAAVDAGQIVNPDGVINQIEGGIIQSISWTLKESVRFDRTRVTTRSWADYPILRFDEVPQIDVVLLNQPPTNAFSAWVKARKARRRRLRLRLHERLSASTGESGVGRLVPERSCPAALLDDLPLLP